MKKFAIVTDSGCDMPKEYFQAHGIVCAKLGFMINGVNYGEDSEQTMSEKQFYAQLREGAMPTTYQVTGEQAKEILERILKQEQDVFALTFSSALSGTSGSFIVAKRQLERQYPNRKIVVVDSLCASMGQGLLLDYIVKKAETGATIEEVQAFAEQLKGQICHHFTVDNLFHLKRGGRVSATTAIVGSILKIKPILHVNEEGKLVSIDKAMGRKKALKMLVDRMVLLADLQKDDPIFISHGDCESELDYIISLVKSHFPENEIKVHYIGAAIGAHSGENTVALFHKGTQR